MLSQHLKSAKKLKCPVVFEHTCTCNPQFAGVTGFLPRNTQVVRVVLTVDLWDVDQNVMWPFGQTSLINTGGA